MSVLDAIDWTDSDSEEDMSLMRLSTLRQIALASIKDLSLRKDKVQSRTHERYGYEHIGGGITRVWQSNCTKTERQRHIYVPAVVEPPGRNTQRQNRTTQKKNPAGYVCYKRDRPT